VKHFREEDDVALVQVAVCDVCQDIDRETTQFRIAKGEDEVVLDLCNVEHAVPLNDLLAGRYTFRTVVKPAKKAAKKAAAPGRPPAAIKVLTMEEIEALKIPEDK
jgi:hypothetical protein